MKWFILVLMVPFLTGCTVMLGSTHPDTLDVVEGVQLWPKTQTVAVELQEWESAGTESVNPLWYPFLAERDATEVDTFVKDPDIVPFIWHPRIEPQEKVLPVLFSGSLR